MAASGAASGTRLLLPRWRMALKSLAVPRGRWAGAMASRGLFGGSKDRPKVSQSKVLSGDDGPLYTLESELSGTLIVSLREYVTMVLLCMW